MKRLLFIFFIVIFCSSMTYAQKVKVVSGEYIYYPSESESMLSARQTALYRAQMQILADTYGTVMNMTSATVVRNSAESSSADTFSLGESSVKGEWLETVGEPVYETIVGSDGMLAIKVTVTGKVREIRQARTDIAAKVLRNGLEDKYEDTDFMSGDDMYLSFSAPADGFLSVYLYDGAEDVYCLLPYRFSKDGITMTEAGKRYVFFSSEKTYGTDTSDIVDEYVLTCSGDMELNRMYVIWSVSPFIKANDSGTSDALPRSLSYASFQKWLSQLKMHDDRLVVKTIDMQIRNKH